MGSGYETELISVIIPTYNRAQFLAEALDSVWNQTYRPIELLIVDDGSTDETPALVEKWTDEHDDDPEFAVRYLHQENSGACAARNLGLIKSRGEYLTQVDSDDLIHPQKLVTQHSCLQAHPEADFAWSNRIAFEDGSPVEMPRVCPSDVVQSTDVEENRRPQGTYPQAALFRREVCEEVGPWNEGLARWQDWEYSFRVALGRFSAVRTGNLYYHREHSSPSIGDLQFRAEGVSVNLDALRAIESDLIEAGPPDIPVYLQRTVRRLYLNTLRHALARGTHGQVRQCFQGAMRHGASTDRLKLMLMSVAYRLAGRKVTRSIFDAYSSFMTS